MRILWEFSLRKGLVVVVFCYTLHLLLADGNLVPLNLWQLDFLKLWASWIISDHGPPTCEYHHWSRHETCCPMTDPVQLLIKIPLRKVVKIRLLNYETEPEKATASWKYRYICIYIYIVKGPPVALRRKKGWSLINWRKGDCQPIQMRPCLRSALHCFVTTPMARRCRPTAKPQPLPTTEFDAGMTTDG